MFSLMTFLSEHYLHLLLAGLIRAIEIILHPNCMIIYKTYMSMQMLDMTTLYIVIAENVSDQLSLVRALQIHNQFHMSTVMIK